jgi:hypothetical protein
MLTSIFLLVILFSLQNKQPQKGGKMKRLFKTSLKDVEQVLTEYKAGCSDHYVPLELVRFTAKDDNIGLRSDSIKVGREEFGFKPLGERQFCRFIEVNGSFFAKCNSKNRQGLFDQFSKDVLHEDPTKEIFVRTHNNRVRGVLSNNYGTFDDLRLFSMIKNILGDKAKDVQVRSFCKDDDSGHMDLQLYWKDDEIDLGAGPDGKPDIIKRGFDVSNSELGLGPVRISPMLWRQWCSNGAVRQVAAQSSIMRHYGDPKKLEKKIGALIWNMDKFHSEMVDHLRKAKQEKITKVAIEKFILETARSYSLTDDQANVVINAWHKEEGNTKFHVASAFTRAAHESETFDGHAGHELEIIGNSIIDSDISEMVRNIERADAARAKNKKESEEMKVWTREYADA